VALADKVPELTCFGHPERNVARHRLSNRCAKPANVANRLVLLDRGRSEMVEAAGVVLFHSL
jgi:hypothetical protein